MSENLLETTSLLEETKEEKEVNIPEKFLDKKTGEVNVQALLKSYLALEKKLSETAMNTPKIPSSIEEYEIICNHDYFEPDPELNQRLLENGFTKEQAQLVYDLAEEAMMPMIGELASLFQRDKEKERLEDKFGGKEKWFEVSRQLLQYGKKNLPEPVLEGLTSSYDGVVALHNMMQSDSPIMSISDDIEGELSEKELHKMMKDSRYWKTKDPAFIAKVTEGFKKLYN